MISSEIVQEIIDNGYEYEDIINILLSNDGDELNKLLESAHKKIIQNGDDD